MGGDPESQPLPKFKAGIFPNYFDLGIKTVCEEKKNEHCRKQKSRPFITAVWNSPGFPTFA
ncbi:MAG: hypothetical protein CMN32_08970 [Saprospirales bacterium]|nr:hypothetical protein [Saprospirales bacterium]